MKDRVPYTRFHKILEGISLALFLLTALWLVLRFPGIPEQIPSHFGFSGEADAWRAKGFLFILLGVDAVLYLGLTLVARLPARIWNTPVEVTEKNRDFVYGTCLSLLLVTKLVLTGSFSYILMQSIGQRSLGGWYLPVFLLLIFAPMIYYLVKCVKGAKILDRMEDDKSA